jgi:hypothetical protein
MDIIKIYSKPEINTNPTEVISNLLKSSRWKDYTPYMINNGNCDEFAEDIINLIGGTLLETDFDSSNGPDHIWVYHNKKHYDAETPGGVSNWKSLPIFNNLYN